MFGVMECNFLNFCQVTWLTVNTVEATFLHWFFFKLDRNILWVKLLLQA